MASDKPTSFRIGYQERIMLTKLAKKADRSRNWVVNRLIREAAKAQGLNDN